MIHFFRLIRWPNLMIIALTQILTWNCVAIDTVMHPVDFGLLVISTILVAAAGYIINDYYDSSIDMVNKPDRVIIGKFISRDRAFALYVLLNLLGILIGLYLGWKIRNYRGPDSKLMYLGMIHLLTAGLLYFYSTTYKGILLAGNLVIALICAIVPLLCGLFSPDIYGSYNMLIILAYAVFAFLITLIREILKDAEDIKGDMTAGYSTIPIVLGIKLTKIITIGLVVLTMALLAWAQIRFIRQDWVSNSYFTLMLQIPMIYLIRKIFGASDKKDFNFAGDISKLIMLTGILSMLVFRYTVTS